MNTNEWGQLRKVIVGVADHAKIPDDIDISFKSDTLKKVWNNIKNSIRK